MTMTRIIGIALIVAGALGLLFGSFSYTKEDHEAKLGNLELSMKSKETINIPIWAGVLAIAVGGGLLLASKKA